MSLYLELTLNTPENVYSPGEDSCLAAELLETELNVRAGERLSVLDMGTGSGILGLTAAASPNVSKVLLADINAGAIATAKSNLALNPFIEASKCSFVQTDLFSRIPSASKFDIMLFNAPYLPSEQEKTPLKLAWDGGAGGVELTIKFLEEGLHHLPKDGSILIVHSSFAKEKVLKRKIKSLGLVEYMSLKRHIFFEDIFATLLKKE